MVRPNYRIFSSIFAVILWGLWSPLFAADSTFRVDSYIPEKFVDFSWQINGGTSMDFNRRESNSSYEFGQHGSYDRNYEYYYLDFNSINEYRYEITPFSLYLKIEGGLRLTERDEQYDDINSDISRDFSRSIRRLHVSFPVK